MASKNQPSVSAIKSAKSSSDSSEKLASIKTLLFGEEVAQLEQALEKQRQYMDAQVTHLEELVKSTGQQLESQIKSSVDKIQKTLDSIHSEHTRQETLLDKKLLDVGKQLSEFQSLTQSGLKDAHQELDHISKEIYASLNKEVNQLSLKIDNTSKELGSNKADRKTLAMLLESMATNLNQSQA